MNRTRPILAAAFLLGSVALLGMPRTAEAQPECATTSCAGGIKFPVHVGDPIEWQRALQLLALRATPFVIAFDRSGTLRGTLPGRAANGNVLTSMLDLPTSKTGVR